MFVRTFVAIVVALAFLGGDAYAQCQYAACQSDGAVSLPSGWDISLPFERGERVRVLSGYGPLMGSGLHCRAQDSSCANDWHALDLVLPDYAQSGKGQPVIAIADGVVIDAQYGSSGWANYGRRVYLRHDVDGTMYTSMYAHLDSINVTNGQQISKGDRLGTLGQSCQGADSCASFSTPHLHFSIHRGANFGGSGSGGSYGGRAVLPEPMDGYAGLVQNMDMTSENGAPPAPVSCGILIGAEEVVIEDDGPCGEPVGTPSDSAAGSGGHSYSASLANPSPDYGTGLVWHLEFETGGSYDIWASVPAGADAREADYKIQHAGGESTHVIIDQQAALDAGEVRLGRFDFDTTLSQWIRLGDNYADANNQGQTFVMDSIRVIPAALCACDEPGTVTCEDSLGAQLSTCDGCRLTVQECANNTTGGTNGMTGGAVNGTPGPNNQSSNNNGTTQGPGTGPTGGSVITAEGGCCSTIDHSGTGTGLFLLLAAGVLRRRL